MRERRGRPIFFIDIAVPRDIDADVGDLENVYLYNIDDLQAVVDQNLDNRRVEAERAGGDRRPGSGRVPRPKQRAVGRSDDHGPLGEGGGRPAGGAFEDLLASQRDRREGTAGHRRPHAGDRPEDPSPRDRGDQGGSGRLGGRGVHRRRAAPLQPEQSFPPHHHKAGKERESGSPPLEKGGSGGYAGRGFAGRSSVLRSRRGGMRKNRLRIGTRGSALALWQANHVLGLLRGADPGLAVEIVTIKTTGDKILDSPLAQVGGKGLFVKEIEEALLAGEVDLAVHSLKDVPAFFPDGLGLAAVLEREDPRDALLARDSASLDELPKGARVGTRARSGGRPSFLHLRPDLEITTLRGNVDTRVRKFESGEYDAIVLAAAGLRRMGLAGRVSAFLDVETLLPAVGQGAIGIETRMNDSETNGRISSLDHVGTRTAVSAERAFLRRLEGGCQVPIAAYAVVSGGSIEISGLVASLDGRTVIRDQVEGASDQAETLGVTLAEQILERGGREILDAVYQAAGSGRTRIVPSPLSGNPGQGQGEPHKDSLPLDGEGQGGGV